MNIWLVIDTQEESGSEAIKGVFSDEIRAKLFLSDYVLKNSVNSDYLQLAKKKVEEVE
ncbi:hypothetical protein [Halalkalibacterium halodurans]|uniref:hypothetical protein n=1 Tax=Halalkalibacterium halodurans TaxID=86665 RepID=UPI002AA9F3D1|nr:hypothetical protein [Halalkalibacterium halodurans]MDY7224688.1 hypothetical protein [Halalkalibacterium halodurans]MDY7243262.1 hypothetical protein [Halalkalibacterium halodurans]